MKQLEFIPTKNKYFFKGFGGELLKDSHAKIKRPISTKFPIHLVIRSSQAKGPKSFRHGRNHKKVDDLVRRLCKKNAIKLYEYANVGNHLHLLLKLNKHSTWRKFIRELTGRLVMGIMGHGKREKPFFDKRPFTRICNGWTKAYRLAKDYVILNALEGAGIVDRRASAALVFNTA